MKRILTILSAILSTLLVLSCISEPLNPQDEEKERNHIMTKGTELSESYYWYRGEKIPLVPNHEYINVLLSDANITNTELKELCTKYNIEIEIDSRSEGIVKARYKEVPWDLEQYSCMSDNLRADPRVKGVYPFFERGHGANPIGTSNVFYIRLRGDDQDGIPPQMQQFDATPLQDLSKEKEVQIVRNLPYMPDWYVLDIADSSFDNSIDASNCFYESGLFADVDPAFMFAFQPCSVNDPLFSSQWGLKNTSYPGYDINVENAWAITTGYGALVAIIDQGVDGSQSDLSPNFASFSYDAQSGTAPSVFSPGYSHGTHVAGIISAKGNNNLLIAGVAYDSQLLRISHNVVISSTLSAELADGISFAWSSNAEVINCSWGDQGGAFYNYFHTSILEAAIENALTMGRAMKGTVVVFAAGNYGSSGPMIDYPASFDDRILTVGSIRNTGYRSVFSGYGDELDVVAPGEEIISTMPGNTYWSASGTSMAAPHVSGVAALMFSVNHDLTRESVVRFIEQTARKISPSGVYTYSSAPYRFNGAWNDEVGYGLVDAATAVAIAYEAGTTPPSNSPTMDAISLTNGPLLTDYVTFPSSADMTVIYSLQSAQINSAYTYYWHFTRSGDINWAPEFDYVGDDNGVTVIVPSPQTNSILNMYCEVYNGSTHICTAVRSLHFSPN